MSRWHNNKTQMMKVFRNNPDGIVEHAHIFSAGKWYNEIKYNVGNDRYPMTLPTLNSLIKDGTLVLTDKEVKMIGQSPFSYTNKYYYYKVM